MKSYFAAIFVVTAFGGHAAFACSCARQTVERAKAGSDLVLTGTVLAERPSVVSKRRVSFGNDEIATSLPVPLPVTKIDIGVSRIYKGTAVRQITLTHFGCCVCEQWLEVGKEYLLFIRPHHSIRSAYMAYLCDPNAPVSEAKTALNTLGPPKHVHAQVSRARSLVRRFLDARDHAANVVVSFYSARVTDNPFIQDPLETIRESLWIRSVAYLGGGVILAVCVVVVRRRRLRQRAA